jgi:3-phosphoshikimate 1-carboxyvinyltransferase
MDPKVFLEPLERLPDPLPVPVLRRPFDLAIRPPGSKSLTNRALLLAALAEGESTLHGALTEAEDARVMIAALEQLGALIAVDGDEVRVIGVGGRWRVPVGGVTLNLQNAGTATRFLTAAAILAGGGGSAPITIDGNERMRERPIGELVELLRRVGARAEYTAREGYPPVRISPPGRLDEIASELSVGETASSQFVSAMLLAGIFLPRGLVVRLTSEPTSKSYIEMTIGLLQELGARAEWDVAGRVIRVWPTRLYRFDHAIEPDASGATYLHAAAAISPGSACLVPGLGENCLQGDAAFVEVLEMMGARLVRSAEGVKVRGGAALLDAVAQDLSLMPDTAMTLAAACCFAPGRSVIGGLKTLRVKETDRLAALQAELTKLGVGVTIQAMKSSGDHGGRVDEALCIVTPEGGIDCSPGVARVEFETYKDHRMAMAMALIGLRRPNVFIRDPGCVAKTYPTYWRDFAKLYGVE